jgi:N-acetylneuraminate synthase
MYVAELGTNWNGDYALLEYMVDQCKKCDIDYVKFQALSPELIARHPELTWYKYASVNEDNIVEINRICASYNMPWFCTPCYPEAVEFLDEYVPFYKVRHADNERLDILQACINTGKPVYVSTTRPMPLKVNQVYCIPKYPTSFGEINFDMIRMLGGYSNHCLNPLAVLKAVRFGAKYVEFHVTADNTEFALDNKVSYTIGEMREIMKWVRLV